MKKIISVLMLSCGLLSPTIYGSCKDVKLPHLKCNEKNNCKERKQKFPAPNELGIANNPNKQLFPQTVTDEPTIAVNPTNACNIVISANDMFNKSGVNFTGVYTSFDAGHSWNQQIIDWSPTGFSSQLDNSVAFGPKPSSQGFSYKNGARAYLCADVFPNEFTLAENVAFAFSDDGGINWQGLQIIPPIVDATVENDKPVLTADLWCSSPNFGNVYVTWTHMQFNNTNQDVLTSESIQVVTSTDGGVTFSAPITISSSDVTNQRRFGSFPVVSCDGTIYVFWWEIADIQQSNGFFNVINGNKSVDGGKTWLAEPFRVATITHPSAVNFPFSPLPGTTLFGRPIPSAAADSNNNVFVVFPNYDVSLGHGWLSLARSCDGGCTWKEQVVADVPGRSPLYPSVSANRYNDSSQVAVSFMAFDDVPVGTPIGIVKGDAYSVLSDDHGKTFSHPPTKVSTQSFDPNAASGSFVFLEFMGDYTWVTDSPNGSFYYAWTDSRRGAPCAAVTAFRNGGPFPDINTCDLSTFGRTDIFVANIKSTCKESGPCVPLVGEIIPTGQAKKA